MYIEDRRDKFDLMQVTIKCGHQQLECELSGVVLQYAGYYMYKCRFNLHSLYTALGLTAYQGQRWTWVAKNLDTWAAYGQQILPEHKDFVLRGMPNDTSKLGEEGVSSMPWPTVSTFSLLALLVRFSSAPSAQAGALRGDSKFSAKALCQALLLALQGRAFDLELFLSGDVLMTWPRPAAASNAVVLQVDEELQVCLAVDFDSLASPADPTVQWLSDLADRSPSMGLYDFMATAHNWRPRTPSRRFAFFGQLILQVGIHLDLALSRQPQQRRRGGGGRDRCASRWSGSTHRTAHVLRSAATLRSTYRPRPTCSRSRPCSPASRPTRAGCSVAACSAQ